MMAAPPSRRRSNIPHVVGALFCALLLAVPTAPYRILMLPLIGKSHVFSFAALSAELASRGHEVSFFVGRHFPLDVPELQPNRTTIGVVKYDDRTAGVPTDYEAVFERVTTALMDPHGANVAEMLLAGRQFLVDVCRHWTMQNDAILDDLDRRHFDLAVVDGLFYMKCIYLIPHRLRIPWVTYVDDVDPLVIRVPWLPSFVPHNAFPFTDSMRFVERFLNAAAMIAFTNNVLRLEPPADVVERYQRYGAFRQMDQLMTRSWMWLIGTDPVLDYARPMMPNMVNVGGLTVGRSVGVLSDDIRDFVDGGVNGTVLMTFGTMASSLPPETVRKFASAFRRLGGYRVVWRLNNKDNVELPDNVMIRPWLPQNDILAHPRTKLFITHCGNNGQYEAVYHAVPMIGFPILDDQFHNAHRLEYKGYGVSMNLHAFTADELLENINRITRDTSYEERMSKASQIFRSQPQTPVERASFWIEHVCRFGGDHLHSAGNDLPIYSYLMLDLVGAALAAGVVVLLVVVKLFRVVVVAACGALVPIDRRKAKTE